MKNTEIIKGLDVAISGLQTIKAAIEAENSGSNSDKVNAPASVSDKAVNKPAIGKKAPAASAPATKPAIGGKKSPAPATADTGSQTYTVAELEGMKYNEFKKLAASLGVSCTGTRADIMERVIGTGVVSDAEGGAKSTPATTKPAPATKGGLTAGGKKLGAKTPAKPAKDEFDEQAEEIAKETPVKDIIAALADVGVKANKADAVTKLAQALRDNLLSLDEDGEEGEAEAEGEDGEEGIDANSYFADYDPEGYNDPDNMTEARSEAVVEKMDAVLTEVSEGTLTQDMMIEFLQTVCTQDELDLLGDDYTEDDIVALYMEMTKRMIDNDGEEHEPGEPYELGEENMCCGHPLSYDESNGVFICDRCTGEYTAQ